jgi:hypothetical protein
VDLVGSYYTDISRCTVNKTLNLSLNCAVCFNVAKLFRGKSPIIQSNKESPASSSNLEIKHCVLFRVSIIVHMSLIYVALSNSVDDGANCISAVHWRRCTSSLYTV